MFTTLNLRYKSLFFALAISCICVSLLPAWGINWKLHYFLPALVICVYKRPPQYCYWLATCCGLWIDLLSGSIRLGTHAFVYICTVYVFLKMKSYFFPDNLSTLPVLVGIGSVFATALLALFQMNFSPELFLYDCLFMACADSGFAFLVFVLPSLLFNKRPRRANEYFS